MTEKHLSSSSAPLYEATFIHDQVLIRSDIVIPSDTGLKVIEVKSAAQIKEYHLWDCAVQYRVLQGLGLNVREMSLAVVDSSFVYPGGGNYFGLLRAEDVTAAVFEMQSKPETGCASA